MSIFLGEPNFLLEMVCSRRIENKGNAHEKYAFGPNASRRRFAGLENFIQKEMGPPGFPAFCLAALLLLSKGATRFPHPCKRPRGAFNPLFLRKNAPKAAPPVQNVRSLCNLLLQGVSLVTGALWSAETCENETKSRAN